MSIRFLADGDFKRAVVTACRIQEPAIDFVRVVDVGPQGLPDPEVLSLAARLGRVLVSHDLRTMPTHFASFLAEGNRSPGVLLITQAVSIRVAIESLVLVWAACSASELENRIHYLPSFRPHVFRR